MRAAKKRCRDIGGAVMENLKIRKWWWAWDYEMIEAWLEEKALNGYMVSKVTGSGEIFHFIKTAPKRVRYCVDYQNKLTPEYIQLLTDDGWSYCIMPGGWIACWKEYDDIRPELYNDYDTVINRNNRLLAILTFIFLPSAGLIYFFNGNLINIRIFEIPFLIMYFLVLVFYVFAVARLATANAALKKKKALQNK